MAVLKLFFQRLLQERPRVPGRRGAAPGHSAPLHPCSLPLRWDLGGWGGGEKNPAVPSPTSRAPRIRPRGPASHREYKLLKRTRHFIWRCYPAFPHQRIPGMTPGRSRSRWRERPGFLSSDLSNHPSHSGPVALSKLCLL